MTSLPRPDLPESQEPRTEKRRVRGDSLLESKMSFIRSLQITTPKQALQRMKELGVEGPGLNEMKGHCLHFNLKVEGIPPRIANLLKQEMLALGGDAVVDSRGFDCSLPTTDTLLMGTWNQLEGLILKLNQISELEPLGQDLRRTLDHTSKTLYTIHCRTRTFTLGKRTLLMGILNVTPDSFSDGGLYFEKEKAIAHGLRMIEEGADLIDIGGESTRPGSKPIGVEEELRRVVPVVETLARERDTPISIDTYKAAVARKAIEAGAQMINDISGLHFDPSLAEVAAQADVPLVLMHIRGTPETMQVNVHYDSLFSEILKYLKEGIERAESAGVDPDQILVDPGIGFGKTVEDNLLLLKHLAEFRVLGKPILLGTSRKSFIGKILGTEVHDRLEGSLASMVVGVLHGAHILRCHDIPQAKRALAIVDAIRMADEGGDFND